jgi:hypothetical protein
MYKFKYIWREIGGGIDTLATDAPVTENVFLNDLVTAKKYFVDSVCDSEIRTIAAGTLPESELRELRERAQFTPTEFSLPFDLVVFEKPLLA